MASGQTSNIGLNQWEPGDQVLREEFNADNVKIDQILAGMERKVRLKEFVLTEDANSIEIPLSDIDLARYERLGIELQIQSSSGLCLQPNGLEGTYFYGSTNALSSDLKQTYIYTATGGSHGHGIVELFAHWNSNILAWVNRGYNVSSGVVIQGHTLLLGYEDMAFLRFYERTSSSMIRAGSRFRFYGVLPW